MYENKLRSSCTSVKFQKLWGKKILQTSREKQRKKEWKGCIRGREGGRERGSGWRKEEKEKEKERETDRRKENIFSQNIKNQKDRFSVATLEGRIEWSNGFEILRETIYNF